MISLCIRMYLLLCYIHTLDGWLVYLVISRHNNTTRNSGGGGALTLCGIAPKLYKKRNIKLNDNSPWIIICAKTVVGGCVVPYIILVLLLLLQYQRATLAKTRRRIAILLSIPSESHRVFDWKASAKEHIHISHCPHRTCRNSSRSYRYLGVHSWNQVNSSENCVKKDEQGVSKIKCEWQIVRNYYNFTRDISLTVLDHSRAGDKIVFEESVHHRQLLTSHGAEPDSIGNPAKHFLMN